MLHVQFKYRQVYYNNTVGGVLYGVRVLTQMGGVCEARGSCLCQGPTYTLGRRLEGCSPPAWRR